MKTNKCGPATLYQQKICCFWNEIKGILFHLHFPIILNVALLQNIGSTSFWDPARQCMLKTFIHSTHSTETWLFTAIYSNFTANIEIKKWMMTTRCMIGGYWSKGNLEQALTSPLVLWLVDKSPPSVHLVYWIFV